MGSANSYNHFLAAMRQRESGGDYTAVNGYGYIGAYQFGEAALIDLNYVHTDGNAFNNDFGGGFTGKNGINSVSKFLNSPSVQDSAAREWFDLLWDRIVYFDLESYAGQTLNGVKLTKSGMIAASHLLGTGGLRDFIKSGGADVGSDANNTKITEYLEHFAGYQTPSGFKDNGDLANELVGGNGRDKLIGRDGNDLLIGNGSKDVLFGDAGKDTLKGGDGRDKLFGKDGADRLIGGNADDTLEGGNGRDFLQGASGRDILFGQGGSDRILGGDDADTLVGGSGDDYLRGGKSADRLIGGTGDDRLFGDRGTDIAIYGGSRQRYKIVEKGDSIHVTDKQHTLGTDVLIDIELIKFGNTVIDVDDLF